MDINTYMLYTVIYIYIHSLDHRCFKGGVNFNYLPGRGKSAKLWKYGAGAGLLKRV